MAVVGNEAFGAHVRGTSFDGGYKTGIRNHWALQLTLANV